MAAIGSSSSWRVKRSGRTVPESTSVDYRWQWIKREPTVCRHALERLLQEIQPVHVQRMQPGRHPLRLEIIGILVRILIAHCLEPRQVQVWQILPIFARGLGVRRTHSAGLIEGTAQGEEHTERAERRSE